LNKDLPCLWYHFAREHPEWSLEVRCAEYVIEDVDYVLSVDAQNPTEAVARLHAERNTW
jgi:hypothetical protein